MPSVKTITQLRGGNYYHIFNRGSNRQNIFYTPANYIYFLKLLKKFLGDYVHFLSYALLLNHFHLVIKIKEEVSLDSKRNRSILKENGSFEIVIDEREIGKLVTKQLKRFFITYAMAINKQENRVGNLFDPKYKRLEITDHVYLEYAIFYTHYNPEKHGLTNDFKSYRYSSYKAITGTTPTSINRNLVTEIYGSKESFIDYNNGWHEEKII